MGTLASGRFISSPFQYLKDTPEKHTHMHAQIKRSLI